MGTAPDSYLLNDTIKPSPPSSESDRITHQALRMRLLQGEQEQDVEAEVKADFAPEVAYDLSWRVDLSENSYLNVWRQLSTAYDKPPSVKAEGVEDFDPIISPSLWPKSQARQLIQLGLNECFVRLDWPANDWEPQEVKYRVVSPDNIYGCRADKDNPERPVYVCELRQRTKEGDDGKPVKVWTYEKWDISDRDNPKFWIEEDVNGKREDVTTTYVGETEDYPYRDTSGAPILPYTLYHSAVGTRLWNYKKGVELVRGTLRLASAFCWWFDSFKNCASPVRVAVDLDLPAGTGITMSNGTPLSSVVYSPKTIIKMSSVMDRTGSIQTFPPGLDPESGLRSLKEYGERLAVYAGLNPGDLRAEGTPKSGIAIVVSREGMRNAQLRNEPANRSGDQMTLATAARLANSYGGYSLPENPRAYRIKYALVGISYHERKTQLENVRAELDMGLISRVQAVRILNPEFESDAEAAAYLLEVGEQQKALDAVMMEDLDDAY